MRLQKSSEKNDTKTEECLCKGIKKHRKMVGGLGLSEWKKMSGGGVGDKEGQGAGLSRQRCQWGQAPKSNKQGNKRAGKKMQSGTREKRIPTIGRERIRGRV